MAKQLFANNASALLAASIDDNDLTIQVASTYGALFPNPGAGEEFIVTLINASGDIEHCRCTSRTTDLITVASGGRGYDGTSPQSWTNGQTRVEYRLTKAVMETFIQRGGDTMSGDLDMNGNDIIDAVLSGSSTKMTGGQIVGVPLRGTTDDSSNEIAVPSDGSPATAGGAVILTVSDTQNVRTAAFAVGMIMDWYGAAVDCPAGWAICDGTNGTPDMRGLFSRGVDGSYALGTTGGAATVTPSTSSAGAHTHTASTPGHALTADENGPHSHEVALADLIGGGGGSHTEGDAQINASGTVVGSTRSSGSGTPHTHPDSTTSSDGSHSHSVSVDTLPPFRAMYKIMFKGF